MSTCFLDRSIFDKLMKMSGPTEESFVMVFEEHVNKQIPWSAVHWVYLRARAAHCRSKIDLPESVQEILWVTDVLHEHTHLLWFGILCQNHITFNHVVNCFNQIRIQGAAHLHHLWEHFKPPLGDPVATETPTPQLKSEFQLAGKDAPVRNVTDNKRCVQNDGSGLETAFANVSSIPTVVYSWDNPGAFTNPE